VADADGRAVTQMLGGMDPFDPAMLHAVARALAGRHGAAPAGSAAGFARAVAATLPPPLVAEWAARRGELARRAATGAIRRLDGADADPLHDLATVLADLIVHGSCDAAAGLANRYFDIAPQGATGWALLPLFTALHLAEAGQALVSDAALAPVPPRLLVVGGLSGTGKSTLSRILASRIGRVPGARVLRSDVIRKRLFGLGPEEPLAPGHYDKASDQDSYATMFESAYDHLGCGNAVVLDAVFLRRSERDVAEALADRARVPFTGLWLEAPEPDRLARVSARLADASDASEAVVREQSRRSVGEIHWHRIRTNRPLPLIVAAARAALDRRRR
jgi:uncharacterized protein